MWSDIDACFDDLASRESNWKFDIVRGSESVVAVDEGFVQIENQTFFA